MNISAKKKKISLDLPQDNLELLMYYCDEHDCNTSSAINNLIYTFLSTSHDVRKELSDFCFERYQDCLIAAESTVGFERDSLSRSAREFKYMSLFYNNHPEHDFISHKMKRTYLSDGYVIYPSDWIVLPNIFGTASECKYAGVVESRNSIKYGIPHFIFFSDTKYQYEYTDEMEAQVYDACAKVYPRFKELYNLQKELPKLDSPNYREELKEWDSAPKFALFSIVEKGDPLYWDNDPDYHPPAGAMIIRD